MKDFNALELIGLFQAIHKEDDNIEVHKEAIKTIKLNKTAKFKEFASSNDVPVTKLKSAYKYYVSKIDNDEAPSEEDPLYDLMMKVDMGLEAELESKQG